MTDADPDRDGRGEVESGVFLLPLAVPEPIEVQGVDADVLARRVPDVLHQLLNGGRSGPTGMLEVQSSPDEGPPRWITLSDVPSPDEVFTMLGGGMEGALVAGTLRQSETGLVVDLTVHFADDDDEPETVEHGVHAVVSLEDPAGSVLRIAEHLAQILGLPFRAPDARLLTANAAAFFRFLEGLDGAALLTGDPDLESDRFGEQLVEPFADALRLDPSFGLALRTLADALFPALVGERVSEASCHRVLEACLAARPTDGEGCLAIADQLALMGEDVRARAWLEHAVGLDAPPARALESLGVALANDGSVDRARALWRRGLDEDGHPDFFAHLARLAFSEQRDDDGWEFMLRGLWRKLERVVRAAEWDDDGRGGSVLLRYLAEHLDDGACPFDVAEALADLAGQVTEPPERVDLGLCLHAIGRDALAGVELREAMCHELPAGVEDRAVRAVLALEVPDFERRFRAASERAVSGRDPRSALVEMQACLHRQPRFWPAMYYAGVALRRLGRDDEALDLMNEVARNRPGQTEAFVEMAEMFDARGNPKRALECVDEAIELSPEDSELHVLRAQCLEHLGRADEAGAELERAIELEPARPRARRRRRRA